MQNLARFWTTLKFDGGFLLNRWRHSKSDKYLIDHDFFCIWRKMSSELWRSNFGNLKVKSYPPKLTFSEDHVSACRGSKFLHVLENDHVLLVHPPIGDWDPLTIFLKGVKYSLKIQLISHQKLGARGSSLMKLPHDVLLGRGDNMGKTFWGHCPFKIWELKKHPKFGVIYDNFWLWPWISLERIKILTSGKWHYQPQSLPCWTKNGWTLVY